MSSKNAKGYMNNPRIRPIGETVTLTKDQLKEYIKCSSNPEYFVERYVKIVTIDEGLVNIKLWKFQKDIINTIHNNNRVVVNAARQVGKTTTIGVGYLLWYSLFQHDKIIAILAQKEKTAIEILDRIKNAYMQLPRWLQQGIDEWNKASIKLENGSKIISESTSSGAIRGFSISLLYLDEFGHVPNNIAHDFLTSVYPTISSGKTSKIIVSSTPNGMNHFYRMVSDARGKRSGFKLLEYDWRAVPHRDKAWEKDQRNTLKDKFDQEHEIEFLGSAGTLISSQALKNLVYIEAVKSLLENKLKIYEEPIPGTPYVLVADCSHGKELDYSAFVILDVSQQPYKVVARYKNNDISAQEYPNIIKTLAKHYNEAFCLVENNDIGAVVLEILTKDLEYENLFYSTDEKSNQAIVSMAKQTPGIRTTKKTKLQGCNALKTLIENGQIQVQDFDIISELTTFVVRKNGSYGADQGANDDLVMCLLLFSWLTTQTFFKDLTDTDMRKNLFAQRERELDEQMPPMPVLMIAEPGAGTVLMDGMIWTVVERDEDMVSDLWSGYPDKSGFRY